MTAPAKYPELPLPKPDLMLNGGRQLFWSASSVAKQIRANVDAAREQDRARAAAPQAAVGVSDAATDAVGNVYRVTETEWQGLDAAMDALKKIAERKQMELGIDGDDVRPQTIADAARYAKYALGLLGPAYATLTKAATKPEAPACSQCAGRGAVNDCNGVVDAYQDCPACTAPAEAPANEGNMPDAVEHYGGVLSDEQLDIDAPAQGDAKAGSGRGYKDFLLAEFGPGMGQDLVQFSIGNVSRAFGAGAASQVKVLADAERYRWLRNVAEPNSSGERPWATAKDKKGHAWAMGFALDSAIDEAIRAARQSTPQGGR